MTVSHGLVDFAAGCASLAEALDQTSTCLQEIGGAAAEHWLDPKSWLDAIQPQVERLERLARSLEGVAGRLRDGFATFHLSPPELTSLPGFGQASARIRLLAMSADESAVLLTAEAGHADRLAGLDLAYAPTAQRLATASRRLARVLDLLVVLAEAP